MFVRHSLLNLPLHKRSRERYYKDHDVWMERQKPAVEKAWRSPFEELPAHIRIHWKDRWYWPPWYFNDVVGFLKIGSNGEEALGGDLFLKRKFFRLSSPERLYRRQEQAKEREEFLYFWSIAGPAIDVDRNETYVSATLEIVAEADKTVRQFGRGTRGTKVWLPDYDLACMDLAAADRQLRRRHPALTSGDG